MSTSHGHGFSALKTQVSAFKKVQDSRNPSERVEDGTDRVMEASLEGLKVGTSPFVPSKRDFNSTPIPGQFYKHLSSGSLDAQSIGRVRNFVRCPCSPPWKGLFLSLGYQTYSLLHLSDSKLKTKRLKASPLSVERFSRRSLGWILKIPEM